MRLIDRVYHKLPHVFLLHGKKTPEHKRKRVAISHVHSSDTHSLAGSCQCNPLRPCRNLSTLPLRAAETKSRADKPLIINIPDYGGFGGRSRDKINCLSWWRWSFDDWLRQLLAAARSKAEDWNANDIFLIFLTVWHLYGLKGEVPLSFWLFTNLF
jgi:hypothetical protein